ncbi:NAD-dependent epimerase/dehydratase family protein [Microbacterium sp. NPDC057650]|uniref:NAD-dependent epimerase/dehydratase family protein n=1 Tax=unclassified Microbacterium TaxID=2609290 RepID=UPI00366CA34B
MRVVVTGGRGLIGCRAVDELVRAGHHVISIVRERNAVPAELAPPHEEVLADAGDPDILRETCSGADGLVHLAAIPSPTGRTAQELVGANSMTTIAVLEAAGESRVPGVVLASSISVLGMAWSESVMSPLYLPVDEAHPLRPTEGYALSKEWDEAAARMAARRWGMTVFALRFPFTQIADAIHARRADQTPEQERALAKELWGYLDVRDAARAVRLAIESAVTSPCGGAAILNIVADDICADEPLRSLLEKWHPGVAAVPAGLRVPYDISAAEAVIGFRAEHLLHDFD